MSERLGAGAQSAGKDARIRIAVDFNARTGREHLRTRLADERRTLRVGAQVVLVDPVEGIQTDGKLVDVNRETGLAAFKVNWWGFEDVSTR